MRRLPALVVALVLVAAAAVAPTVVSADVPYGDFVFDGPVTAIASSPGGVFVAGSFTREQAATGGALALSAGGSGAPDPSSFPKVAGTVSAVAPDGSGGWYLGGGFSAVGGVPRTGLAHVLADGTVDPAWSPGLGTAALGQGAQVTALAVSGGRVYAGGTFTAVAGASRADVAALDATTGAVQAFDARLDGAVTSLAVSGSTLYVAGAFQNAGGQPRTLFAALDATTGDATSWNPAPDTAGHHAGAIVVAGSSVYVSGDFTTIGGQARSGLAALDAATGLATSWNPNADTTVNALAVSGSTVYAGGSFTAIGGQARSGLAALDAATGLATSWNPNADTTVNALAVSGSTVYAGGSFTTIGGQARAGLAALDATTGSATAWDPSPNDTTQAISVSGATVLAGGAFSGAGPSVATVGRLARLAPDGTLDTSWTPNPNTTISALAVSGSTLYAGGSFTAIGGQTRNRVAALDATTGLATSWNPNASNTVNALAVSGSTVYAGGSFTAIGGQSRNRVAALDATTGLATTWNPSSNNTVNALAVSGSTVYAGGSFTSLGGQSRNRLAALDATTGSATSWNPNANGSVSALTVADGIVWVGGAFTTVGGTSHPKLAGIDASTGLVAWWPSGLGVLDGTGVFGLAARGDTVYLAGDIGTTILGTPHAPGAAAFDGNDGALTPFAPLTAGSARAVAVDDSAVYLGGTFAALGGRATGPFGAVDLVPPTVDVTTPTEGQELERDATVAPDVACDDPVSIGSGIQACDAPAIDTSTVGAHTYTATATDRSGNTVSETVNYTVAAPPATGPSDPGSDDTPPPSGETPAPAAPAPSAPAPAPPATPVVTVPPARSCASRRVLRIHLKLPKGKKLRKVTVRINTKLKSTITGRKLAVPIDLRGLPKGTFTLTITTTTTDHHTTKLTKRYTTCAKAKATKK